MIIVVKIKIVHQAWIILVLQILSLRGATYESTTPDSSCTETFESTESFIETTESTQSFIETTESFTDSTQSFTEPTTLSTKTFLEPTSSTQVTSSLNNLIPTVCDALKTTFGNISITWPRIMKTRNNNVYSSPVCLDELKFPKYRYSNNCCNDAETLQCSYIQSNNISGSCPNGESTLLINDEHKICFSNSTKYASSWDYTHCLKYGSTILDLSDYSTRLLNSTILKYIQTNLGQKFWLPIRRENSYSPLQYFMPFLWKRYVNVKRVEGSGDCLSIKFRNYTSEITLLLENCNNQYPILCAYDTFDLQKIDCLDDNYVLHSYPEASTYAYIQNGLSCPYGHMSMADSAETTKVYQMLLENRQCAVNVFPNKDSVYHPPVNITYYNSVAPCGEKCALNITGWVERFSEIKYVNWNVRDIGYGDKIVVDATGGWILHNKPRCTVCEDTIGSSTVPTIILESNRIHRLTLTISVDHLTTPENVKNDSFDNLCNFKKLLGINCFAQYDNLKFRNFDLMELAERNFNTYSSENILTVIDIIAISYNEVYSIKVNSSGRFWCEGYSIFHNLVISSDDLYVEVVNGTENFAVLMKVVGFGDIDEYEIERIFKYDLVKVIKSKLADYAFLLSSVQFKKLISLNYNTRQLLALVHFEMRKEPEFDDNDDDDDDQSDEGEIDYYDLLLQWQTLLWQAMTLQNETRFTFYSINHTQFCLPDNSTTLKWDGAELNEYVTTEDFDLEENGLPIIRQCIGDSIFGGQWGIVNELSGVPILAEGLTKELSNLERLIAVQSNDSLAILNNISSIVASNIDNLTPADLFTISKVFSNLGTFNFSMYNRWEKFGGVSDITALIDSCTQVNESVIQTSQIVNTTNKILYSFEVAISNIGGALKLKRNSLQEKSSNVLVIVLNPGTNNISGISVYKNLTKRILNNDISDYYVEYILSNATVTTFNEGFTIASYVPQSLLDNLLTINQQLRIIFTLFYNDVLYQDEAHADQLDSIVISVTLPGMSSRLPGFMPFYFTSRSNSIYTISNASMNRNNYCSYWNFQPKNKTIKSEWSQEGCHFMGLLTTTLNTTQISACACEHLTSFAFLVGDMEVSKINDTVIKKPTLHGQALDLITLLGCSLSILGALGLFITALAFPVWRRKSGILLQFSAAIAIQMILTISVTTNLIDFQVTADKKMTLCIAAGAAIQYSLLVVFSWTLISAYLQFKRYVAVFNSKPSKLYLKTFIIGWLMPLIPVLLGVFISPDSYRKPVTNSFNVCYPESYALYFTVLLPIALIILANLTIFIIVLRNVFRISTNKFHSNEKDLILSQMRLSVFLFFLLGLSWFFGLAVSFGFGLIFSYLFCLTATVQGLVLFIYFVVMDPETRTLWINLLSCKSYFENKLHS